MISKRFVAFAFVLAMFLFVSGVSAASYTQVPDYAFCDLDVGETDYICTSQIIVDDGSYADLDEEEELQAQWNFAIPTNAIVDSVVVNVLARETDTNVYPSIQLWSSNTDLPLTAAQSLTLNTWTTMVFSDSRLLNETQIRVSNGEQLQLELDIEGDSVTEEANELDIDFILLNVTYHLPVIVANPVCSVDYLQGVNGNTNNFNLSQSKYLNQTGNYAIHGFMDAGSSVCRITNKEYNRTSPNFVVGSWDPAGSSVLYNFIWKTGSYSDNTNYVVGNHTVCCHVESRPCTESSCQTFYNQSCTTFCIDTQAPAVTGVGQINPGNCYGNYVSVAPQFGWNIPSENGCAPVYYNVNLFKDGVSVYNLTNVTSTNFTVPTTYLQNGSNYSVQVQAADLSGNIGAWATMNYLVWYDAVPPTVTITSPINGTWYNGNFVVTEIDSDNLGLTDCTHQIWGVGGGSSNWYPLMNANEACNQPFTVNTASDCTIDGYCTVIKRVRDYACNVAYANVTVMLDRLPPNTTKIVGKPSVSPWGSWIEQLVDGWFVTSDTGFELSSVDSGSGLNTTYYNITYPNGTVVGPTVYDESFNLDDIDGLFTITYWSVDNVGNVETSKYEVDKLDNIAPNTTKIIGDPKYLAVDGKLWVTSNTVFNLSCSDSEVGCDYSEYSINGNDWTYGNQFSIQGEECSANYVDYRSVDRLGNAENVKNETDWLDNNGPTIEIINPTLWELNRTDCYLNVVATIADGCSGIGSAPYAEIRYENGSVAIPAFVLNLNYPLSGGYSNTVDTTALPAGNYALVVYAQDHLGNNNTDVKNFVLNPGIHVQYVSPASCSVPIGSSGSCLFTFNACVRGSDAINMYMEKLGRDHNVDPGQVDATLSNSLGSAQVGIWQTDGFYYATNLSLINDSCQNVNGWVSFNMSMNLNSSHSTILGGNYRVNYTINSFDNYLCG